jgi:V8-like Glu-specific endopeptidase
MPPQYKISRKPPTGKMLLGLLGVVYVVYLVVFGNFVYAWMTGQSGQSDTISEHTVDANSTTVVSYWTKDTMSRAIDGDQLIDNTGNGVDVTQASSDTSAGKAARQDGQSPGNGNAAYPLSTVGKVFFSNASGQNMVCSGTAVVSSNHNTFDTAGHCLYWNGGWVRNVIFCPLYDSGNTPYGCWAARDLEVPSGWINARPGDLHQDFGMAIVSPNSQGNLTDVVGGAGWAYNQPTNSTFYAYGYPAGYPFDGQTRKSCPGSAGKSWRHAGGLVISIRCDMTGGSSGGPWFISIGGNLYLSGHNDFTSSIQPGHMFSPYYDDTWFALYDKAQQT